MASSQVDPQVTEILMTHEDKSHSKKNTNRFMKLYEKHKNEGVPTVQNCNVIQQTYQAKGLAPTGVHTMFAPLLWYAQLYPWFYLPVIGGTGEHRLYVGDLVLNGLHQPLWVGITPPLKFFTSLYKLEGNEYRLTKFNRLGIKWHWALEDVFGLGAMPYEDLNHPLGRSTGAEIFQYLNNEESEWDDRQNNAIESLVWVIEAFPGLSVTPSPTENDTVVQVYPGQPKFPFLVDDIDTSLPDIRTLAKAQPSPNATPATSSSTKANASIAGKPSSSTAATKPVNAPLDANSKAPARAGTVDSASPASSP